MVGIFKNPFFAKKKNPRFSGPDPDDMYDQMLTNDDGEFSLSGSGVELTPIDPEVCKYYL